MKQESEHYQNSIETIDMIESMGKADLEGFLKGNILKYTTRHRKKAGVDPAKDSYKILDYACKLHTGKWFHEVKELEEQNG